MKLVIDTDTGRLMIAGPEGMRDLPLYSSAGLAALKQLVDDIARKQPALDDPSDVLRSLVASAQPTTIVIVGWISPSLLSHFSQTTQHTLIVVDSEYTGDLHNGRVHLLEGDIRFDETVERVRAASSLETNRLVALQLCSSPNAAQEQAAQQQLENCAALVSVGSYLIVAVAEPIGAYAGQLEAPSVVHTFAMEHGEFRLMKSPVSPDAGGFWLQRVK